MMIFTLRLRMHTERVSTFHLWLIKAGRKIGIMPTNMTSESEDVDLRNPDFRIYSFVCQAEAALKPQQLVALFGECARIGAVVLGIVYQETEHEEEDQDNEDWDRLVGTAKRTPGPPVVVRRAAVTPLPVRLRVIQGGSSDDSTEK